MIILVTEINFLNFPIYYVLSFFYKVITLEFQSITYKSKRIKLLNLLDYLSWEDCKIIESDAVKICKESLSKLPVSDWKIKIKKQHVDLSLKAKQDLQKEIKKISFLKGILSFCRQEKICIIRSLKLNFLAKTAPNEAFCFPTIKFLSVLNVFFDRLNFFIINIFFFVRIGCQFVYGLIFNKRVAGKIRYIYDGVVPRELSLDKNENTFSWISDNKLINKSDILFLLPKADFQMKKHARDYTKDKELLATTHFSMLTFSSYKKLFSNLPEFLKIGIKTLLPLFSFRSLMRTRYSISILKWLPIIDSLCPEAYINTVSNNGIEEPGVAYFNKIGIKTIMWSYGTNSDLFLTRRRTQTFSFNEILSCNIMCNIFVVWNQHFKEFIQRHPQENLDIKIIGPLMCGDEDILNLDKATIANKLNLFYDRNSKNVAIFDCPPTALNHRNKSVHYPTSNTEEYNYAFLKDMHNLLSEFQDMILIYKPKRSLTGGKFSYSLRLKKLFDDMKANPKVIMLDYNIDPWIPIALADLCISMPFESPNIAALHYAKPAIFHDPLDIAHYHNYGKLNSLITHNFENLRRAVENFLYTPKTFENICKKEDISDFVGGAEPGTNSSTKFREFLKNI